MPPGTARSRGARPKQSRRWQRCTWVGPILPLRPKRSRRSTWEGPILPLQPQPQPKQPPPHMSHDDSDDSGDSDSWGCKWPGCPNVAKQPPAPKRMPKPPSLDTKIQRLLRTILNQSPPPPTDESPPPEDDAEDDEDELQGIWRNDEDKEDAEDDEATPKKDELDEVILLDPCWG